MASVASDSSRSGESRRFSKRLATIYKLLQLSSRPIYKLLQLHPDRFDLRVEIDCVPAELAAEAGLLVAAEGRNWVELVEAVDPDRAGLQRAGHLMGAAQVARPDRGGKPVVGVVALKNRVVFIRERDRCADRAENLLARDPHLIVDAGEQRRVDEVALTGSRLAAGRHLGALLLANVEITLDSIELLARNQRSDRALLIEGIAHGDALAEICQLTHHLVVLVALHENPRARAAYLTRIEEHAHHRGGHGLIEVGVRENDIRRLAAEFQRNLLEVSGGGLEDDLADLRRTGEGDLVDFGMLGDRTAGARSEAGDDVEDTLGQPGFHDQLTEAKGRQRSLLGRLEDDRVAAGERGPKLPRGHQQREIPRDDLPADSNRLAQCVVEESGVRRIGLAVDFRHPSAVIAEGLGRGRNIKAA